MHACISFKQRTCCPHHHITGKVALVTGANSGLGYEAARKLAENGAQVLMVSRDVKNGIAAANRIKAEVRCS
jgi:NAD(P)-dependent dehydrogenase (short-subunit alcohol dehydrogenase family)